MSRKGAETQRNAHGFALTRWVNACLLASASSLRLCAFARHPIAGFRLSVQVESNNPEPGADASDPFGIFGEAGQALLKLAEHSGHVCKDPVGEFLLT
jgi:hypothetical protein